MAELHKIARIAYLNTEPYFHHWNHSDFPLVPGVPRLLAEAAKAGEVAAGPLPVVECWNLEETFEPLGYWGIATKEASGSVFVLSKKPFAELNEVTMGVTQESSTSVALCEVLVRHRYGHRVNLKRGLSPSDDAWLVIGDQALMIWSRQDFGTWTNVTDLATEWWNWQRLPFVFARWVTRRDVGTTEKSNLVRAVHDSLKLGLASISEISAAHAVKLQVPPEKIERYLSGFNYTIGAAEDESMFRFRQLVEKTGAPVLAVT